MMLKRRKAAVTCAGIAAVGIFMICGPLAGRLQMRESLAAPNRACDAIYLVCGARAQDRRIAALGRRLHELKVAGIAAPPILIGTDSQKNRWCSRHQTNHTVTAWAVEKLEPRLKNYSPAPRLIIVPGTFCNTDGEMRALGAWLGRHPEFRTVALVTSRYHARRAYERLRAHAPPALEIRIVSGIPYWKNRSPFKVTAEYLKILRDRYGLSYCPLIARRKPPQ